MPQEPSIILIELELWAARAQLVTWPHFQSPLCPAISRPLRNELHVYGNNATPSQNHHAITVQEARRGAPFKRALPPAEKGVDIEPRRQASDARGDLEMVLDAGCSGALLRQGRVRDGRACRRRYVPARLSPPRARAVSLSGLRSMS